MIDYKKIYTVTKKQMMVIYYELSGLMFWRPAKTENEFEVKLVRLVDEESRAHLENVFSQALEIK